MTVYSVQFKETVICLMFDVNIEMDLSFVALGLGICVDVMDMMDMMVEVSLVNMRDTMKEIGNILREVRKITSSDNKLSYMYDKCLSSLIKCIYIISTKCNFIG